MLAKFGDKLILVLSNGTNKFISMAVFHNLEGKKVKWSLSLVIPNGKDSGQTSI